MEILDTVLNLKFIFGVLMLVIWVGYLFFSIALVGKTRVLGRTLKTGLSRPNVLIAWAHLALVFFVGLISLVFIAL